VVWSGPDHVLAVGGLFARRFASIKEDFVRWWNEGIDPSAPVVWVAFAQLYIDWQLRGRRPGFVVLDGKWWDPKLYPGATPENIPWRKRVDGFGYVYSSFFVMQGLALKRCRANLAHSGGLLDVSHFRGRLLDYEKWTVSSVIGCKDQYWG